MATWQMIKASLRYFGAVVQQAPLEQLQMASRRHRGQPQLQALEQELNVPLIVAPGAWYRATTAEKLFYRFWRDTTPPALDQRHMSSCLKRLQLAADRRLRA